MHASTSALHREPLLTTKLHPPRRRPNLIDRPRLTARITGGLAGKLALISAPAGFGKTTLLGEWLQKQKRAEPAPRVAWLSLDPDDDDPARFWAYVAAAFQTLETGIGQGAQTILDSARHPPIRSALTTLLNEIASATAGDAPARPHVLILDDYHHITAGAIHSTLAFLIEHLPPQAHLLISTRSDPPLPLARLRARGHLTELHAADLRFTSQEASAFLNQVMGLHLAPQDIDALKTRTEGWITGLQLAALSIQDRADARRFIETFTGSHRYVLDYLADEVLKRQPPNVQTFLLRTSILDRLTGDLCDAITGGSDGQQMLERLDRDHLFTVPLDKERRWYRYHPLFAEFLRATLGQRADSSEIAELNRRAAGWCAQNALPAEAVDHALRAGDFERAVALIEEIVWHTLTRGEIASLRAWLQALPQEIIRSRFSLCVTQAWTLFLMGQPLEAIEARVRDAEACLAARRSKKATADRTRFQGLLHVLKAFLGVFQGDISYTTGLSEQIAEYLPEGGPALRSLLALNEGIKLGWAGDVVAAEQAFTEGARISLETGNVLFALISLCQAAELLMAQGRLRHSMEVYQQARELALDRNGHPLPIAGLALIGMGELNRERNDLETASRLIAQGIELCQPWAKIWELEGRTFLARVRAARGDLEVAADTLSEAKQMARAFDASEMDDFVVAAHQAQFWIRQGRTQAASRWEAEWAHWATGNADGAPLPFPLHELGQLTLARLRIAQQAPEKALALVAPLLPTAEKLHQTSHVIECHIVLALARQAQGDTVRAVAALAQALALAEPEGYVRIFADEGPPMAALLREAAARGVAPLYAHRLLAAIEKAGLPEPEPPGAPVEPLTDRELEILRGIAAGLSNREIAEALVVAVSTVKWHINNLYAKLDVHSRTQALARARKLNLLP